ncbi:MAG: dynamin family protein [Akkermansia sp.]
MDYNQFNKAKNELAALASQQLEILKASHYDDIVKTEIAPTTALREGITSLSGDLNTLVMGCFSSGKSAFLNAFLGAKLLPEDVLPCTAVIGEIVYGEEWGFMLFPKDKAKAPFSISRDELKKFTTIPHNEQQKENPYHKLIIHAPLSLCKNGIRMIDSPGLNDPTSHDEVTKAYLPHADAIIYCMHSGQAYSKVDMNTIQELRALGYTSIIFVLTFFDQLEMADMMYGEDSAERCRKHFTKILSPLTDFGSDGIFFVNSRGALKGKTEHNADLLRRSHFDVVETKVEKTLVDEKGRLKLLKLYFETSGINRKNTKALRELCEICHKNHEELKEQVKNARTPLQAAQHHLSFIQKQIDIHQRTIADNASREAGYFYDELMRNIPIWIQNAPTETSFLNVFNLKENIEKFTNEVLDEVKHQMEMCIKTWAQERLSKDIETGLQRLGDTIDDDVTSCISQIENVKLQLGVSAADMSDEESPSTVNRVLSCGLALLMGDIYGAIGGAGGGYKMMLRTLSCEAVGAVVLYIASLFTPIGLPAIILTGILAIFTGGGWSVLSIKENIRGRIAEKMSENLNSEQQRHNFLDKIKKEISAITDKIKNTVNNRLGSSVNEAQHLLDVAEQNLSGRGEKEMARIHLYESLIQRGESLRDQLDSFFAHNIK